MPSFPELVIILKPFCTIFFLLITSLTNSQKKFTSSDNTEIQKIDIEREDEVIGLLMYLDGSNGLELVEHLLVENRSKCIEMKEIAEETSNAYYECEKIKAIVKEKKILKVIEKIEIL